MKSFIASGLILLMASTQLAAAPFDMTPEADLKIVQPETATAVEQAPAEPDAIRYILPANGVQLNGEISRLDYLLYVTPSQATARAQLHLGYLNSLVVAPETSRLRVVINQDIVLNIPVASSSQSSAVNVDIPAGLLKQGFNNVSVSADMRHRTDCDVGATYDLWTRLNSADTYVGFFGAETGRLARLDDIAAIGVDAAGKTTLRLVMPSREGNAALLAAQAVQAITLDMRVPNPVVEFATALSETPEPGVLQVVMGTADTLPAEVGALATEARDGPVAAFVADHPAHNVLVLSGPSEQSLDQAITSVATINQQYPATPGALPPTVSYAHAVPMVTGGQTLALEDLGLTQTSFSGRRFVSTVELALPADFYANNYGQAHISLNTAYSSDVLPGSEVDVFVNGQIASSTPILRTGESVRSLPISVPMKGFRPGRNKIDLVVILRTDADNACAPGTVTVGTDTRLLVASGSTITLPNFGRIGQVPNLSAFAGHAFPYTEQPPHLMVAAGDDGLATGLTAVSRMAAFTSAGVPLKSVGTQSPSAAEPALLVAPYPQLPADVSRRMGVIAPYADTTTTEQDSNVENTLQRWRSQGNSASSSIWGRARNWVADLLNISPQSFGLPMENPEYAPRQSDQAFAIQRVQPEGGVWTLISSPGQSLSAGVANIMSADSMQTYAGYISTLPASPAALETKDAVNVTFFEPSDFSIENLRNIAANWLSGHVMAYALGLALLATILTFATHRLLRLVGRRPQ